MSSDTEKAETVIPDTQDTFYNNPNDSQNLEDLNDVSTSCLNESQDFHLFDADDVEDFSLNQSDAEKKSTLKNDESSGIGADLMETVNSTVSEEQPTAVTTVDTNPVDKSEPTNSENAVDEKERAKEEEKEEKNEEDEDDDDEDGLEIIAGTPPEPSSPRKEKLCLKRKNTSFDEPMAKVLKIEANSDASSTSHLEKVPETRELEKEDESIENKVVPASMEEPVDSQCFSEMEGAKNSEIVASDIESNGDIARNCLSTDENWNDSTKVPQDLESKKSPVKEQSEESKTEKVVVSENLVPVESESKAEEVPTKEKPDNELDRTSSDEKTVDDRKTETEESPVAPVPPKSEEPVLSNGEAEPVEVSSQSRKNRMSIEVIFDRKSLSQESKRKELVEIDEDGEKIVLDSSQEEMGSGEPSANAKDESVYKSCYGGGTSSGDLSYKSVLSSSKESGSVKSEKSNLTNEIKKSDSDCTESVDSDILQLSQGKSLKISSSSSPSNHKSETLISQEVKNDSNSVLISVSDIEADLSMNEETKVKNPVKSVLLEKEINIHVRLKCTVQVDETTKEFLAKEITNVHCDPIGEHSSKNIKHDNTSSSLADISGNEKTSPGSVTSNPQPYQLNPSRLSIMSMTSTSSSGSSAASLNVKIMKNAAQQFSIPRIPARHGNKKILSEVANPEDKELANEALDKLTKEWKNSYLVTMNVLNAANLELQSGDINESMENNSQKMRSSTPELRDKGNLHGQLTTPKSTAKKTTRTKRSRSRTAKSNNSAKVSPSMVPTAPEAENGSVKISGGNRRRNYSTPSKSAKKQRLAEIPEPIERSEEQVHELIGKEVFAKWSDKNYYPGKVVDRAKDKFKVNFYDGKSKVLLEEFVIPIPSELKEGLSVYATVSDDDYGASCKITGVEYYKDRKYYVVETEDNEKHKVQIQDIFLTPDKVEDVRRLAMRENRSLPSTPHSISQVTLDNMVEGKRRNRRGHNLIGTPEPSVSGVKSKRGHSSINSRKKDDTSTSMTEEETYRGLLGVQDEIIGTPNEQIVKGPKSRLKGKARGKNKEDDEETVALLGPIPAEGTNFFEGMSFILTCASLETLDRYQTNDKDSNSDPGTENEEEWTRIPFVRDRLQMQITAAGGKVYESFESIPKEEYKDTKLITNVPNHTAKSLLCLSLGIPTYNHQWIIRCCQENCLLNSAEYLLPAGWSLEKRSYIDTFERPNDKLMNHVIVVIPSLPSDQQFTTFWSQICANAGATVVLLDDPEKEFMEATVVLTNHKCPSWIIEKANSFDIPLLSTTWIVQCLIEGKLLLYNTQPSFKYDYNGKNA